MLEKKEGEYAAMNEITPETYLTPSQRRLLDLIASGMSNKEIAQVRGVEWGTVKNLIFYLSRKLDMNRVQLAVWWATTGRHLYG